MIKVLEQFNMLALMLTLSMGLFAVGCGGGEETGSGEGDSSTSTGQDEGSGSGEKIRSDYTPAVQDTVLVNGVSGDKNALGYFGYAYYVENKDKLKALGIKSDGDCVVPTDESIEGGQYTPLSRPLFIYVNKASLSKPNVKAFVDYYLNEGQKLVSEVGYVKLSAAQLEEAKKALTDATTGLEMAAEDKDTVVKIDGSSTVAPISQAMAEDIIKDKGIKVTVATSGTGGGFKKFIKGETDINDASRPIKDKEAAACKEAGIEFIEIKVAIDGLTVVVNAENDWCDCMSVEQLKKLWEPGSKINKWSEIDPNWPDEEIKLFGPDTESGTFDYFIEAIIEE